MNWKVKNERDWQDYFESRNSMSWVLVFIIASSPLSNNALMNTNSIANFKSDKECQDAGMKIERTVNAMGKNFTFVCVSQ